ncbi:MAG TPA: dienelactone hydrolase family protein [Terrimicrobiaceae bacterium]|nr:dienelactone hydrolase family protein [Terrimicrobiaceae bacterium]
MKTLFSFALVAAFVASAAHASIKTEEVSYSEGGNTFKGFLAWDEAISGKRPGILVVHEWWGLNDYARGRAKQLAELGYTALAVDMYGDGKVADHPKDAGAFAATVMKDPQVGLARFKAAMEFLKSQPTVDPDKIAAIGYCMGGAIVLNAARQGLDLDAVASFHGSLGGLMPIKGPIKAKILVCHGADDSFIPPETVEAFQKEMKEAGADFKFIAYPGAKHGFTNPAADEAGKKFELNIAYNAEADTESWKELKALLHGAFPRAGSN